MGARPFTVRSHRVYTIGEKGAKGQRKSVILMFDGTKWE